VKSKNRRSEILAEAVCAAARCKYLVLSIPGEPSAKVRYVSGKGRWEACFKHDGGTLDWTQNYLARAVGQAVRAAFFGMHDEPGC
jgi:hypothetical protein